MSDRWKAGFGVPAGMEDSDSDDEFCVSNGALDDEGTPSRNRMPSVTSQSNECHPRENAVGGATARTNGDTGNQNGQPYRRPASIHVEDFRIAIVRGNLDEVQALVQQGLDVDTVSQSGWTGLMFACKYGHPAVTRYLLEQKADPNYHKERFTPLMAACASTLCPEQEKDLLKCVEHLIEFGGEISSYDRHHLTPLMFAAREGRVTIVKVLLECGVNMDAVDNRGWTALVWAISKGHVAIVRILLEANASAGSIKNSGQSLVEFACQQEQMSIAVLLEKFSEDKTLPEVLEMAAGAGDGPERSAEKPFTSRKNASVKYGDLEMFLSGLGLVQLIPVFHAHELSLADVLRLSDDDLRKIGIEKFGFRKKILDGSRDVHRAEWRDSSLPSRDKLISCPDAVCMVANIGKHLGYIQSTIGYLREQIEGQPRILELGQDVNNVQTLLQRLDNAISNNRNLHEELRFLKLHLDKIQGNAEYVPADLIVECRLSDVDAELKRRRGALLSLTAAFALVGVAVLGTALKRPVVLARLLTWKT